MINNKLISIIMNCHNGEKFLKEALDSIFSQSYKYWEIIFVDNCSTDNSAKIAKSYNSKLKYFKINKKVSLSSARNIAMQKIKGVFVAFLDCDDLWEPKKLEKQIQYFDNQNIDIISTNVRYFSTKRSYTLYDKIKYYEGLAFPYLLDNFYLCTSSIILRSSALKKVDYLFDANFKAIGDADFLLRLSLFSEIKIVNSVLTKYRIHDDTVSSKQGDLHWKERFMLYDKFKKNYPQLFSKYKKNFSRWKLLAKLTKIYYLIKSQDIIKARIEIVRLPFCSKKLVLYIFTFLPKCIQDKLFHMRGAIR